MSDSDYEERLKTTGRNDPCLCGSGKKYKKCHLAEDQATSSAALKVLHEEALANAKSSEDTEGAVDTKGAVESKRSKKRQNKQPDLQGRPSDGQPKNIQRRGAV